MKCSSKNIRVEVDLMASGLIVVKPHIGLLIFSECHRTGELIFMLLLPHKKGVRIEWIVNVKILVEDDVYLKLKKKLKLKSICKMCHEARFSQFTVPFTHTNN